jgi:hypothetical protein
MTLKVEFTSDHHLHPHFSHLPGPPPHLPGTVDFDGRSAIEGCNAAFAFLPFFGASQF